MMITLFAAATLQALPTAPAPDFDVDAIQIAANGAPTLVMDEPGDGRTWARGSQWKASFGPEGMTYIPFFGSDAPQNYPVEFDLTAAWVGGDPLELTQRDRTRTGSDVTLSRGSLREVYHLSEVAVEQTFVFDELPARGEIALDIAVETELVMAPSNGGFEFWGDLGHVTYGAATAVDARGRTLMLESRITESGFSIVVPADFVAAADLPLVVDPILSTFSVTDISNMRRQISVDVAYKAENDLYQIVYSEAQSALDFDVLAVLYSASMGVQPTFHPVDITSSFWSKPKNASANHAGSYLVAAEVGVAVGSTRIWGRIQGGQSTSLGSQFMISGTGAQNPDVGGKGNSISSAYDYMVVWEEADPVNQDFNIMAQAVDSGVGLTGGPIVIDDDVGDYDRYPSISKMAGGPSSSNSSSEYMVVWERERSATNHDLRAQVIEYTGLMNGHSQFNAYSFSDALDPDVSSSSDALSYGGDRYWMIAFERRIGTDYDIFTVVARDGSADNARNVVDMQDMDQDQDHQDPVISFTGEDYLVSYQTSSPFGSEIIGWTGLNVVHDDGELRTGVSTRREGFAASAFGPASVAIGSRWDGAGTGSGATEGDAVLMWITAYGISPALNQVEGVLVAESRSQQIGSQLCNARDNSSGESAWIRVAGNSWATNASAQLQCYDLPANAFGFFLVSDQSAFTPNPGGSSGNLCLGGSIGRFVRPGEIQNSGAAGFMRLNFTPDSLPGPLGTVSALPGETWYYQTWFRDFGSTSNFSNAVGVTYD